MKNIKQIWKNLHDSKTITSINVVQYCILRAMQSNTENKVTLVKILLSKAFAPIKNKIKLANGQTEYGSLYRSLSFNNKNVLGICSTDIFTSKEEQDLYEEINDAILKTYKSIGAEYVYVFTRQDISPEQQLVQSAHVTLELGNKLNGKGVEGLYFCVVGVPDLNKLREVEKTLIDSKIEHVGFNEPDIHWSKSLQLTSIATYPIMNRDRIKFIEFNKLKFG